MVVGDAIGNVIGARDGFWQLGAVSARLKKGLRQGRLRGHLLKGGRAPGDLHWRS